MVMEGIWNTNEQINDRMININEQNAKNCNQNSDYDLTQCQGMNPKERYA
jgi:hypothetical protein